MPPTLYHIPRTISSPLVQCLLELNAVGIVTVQTTTFPGLKSKEFLEVNPMGTAPAFQDDDIIMWESGAILDYLLERYDQERVLHPPSITATSTLIEMTDRAKYLQLKQYIIATVYPFIATLFLHTLKTPEEQDMMYVKNAKDKWTNVMGPVLAKSIGDGPYFLGEMLSAVDFLVMKPLNNVNAMGLLTDFPMLQDLFDRIRNRPSFAGAYETIPTSTYNAGAMEGRTLLVILNPQMISSNS